MMSLLSTPPPLNGLCNRGVCWEGGPKFSGAFALRKMIHVIELIERYIMTDTTAKVGSLFDIRGSRGDGQCLPTPDPTVYEIDLNTVSTHPNTRVARFNINR